MAYKRKNKKNKGITNTQENKKFVQGWLEKQKEDETIGDWDRLDDEIFENHEPFLGVDVDDFYINELAKEMFPDGSDMEEFRVIFKIGYKRAISDYNNPNL